MIYRFLVAMSVVGIAACASGTVAAQGIGPMSNPRASEAIIVAQVPQPPVMRPPTAAKTAPRAKSCRREPIWGFRMSAFCKPTGICSDRVIKGYRTVCS